MKPSLRLIGALSVAVISLAPLGAATAAPGRPAAKTPPRPDAGTWHVTGDELTGSFRVSSNRHEASHFRATIGPQGETSCGSGKVSVIGRLRIFDAKGMDPEGDRYSEWAVGRNVPTADPVIQNIKVTVVHGGHRHKGHFEMVFVGRRGHSKTEDAGGQVTYGGDCDLQFTMRKS
jgi:hypothetical protein